jgi:hypothetical protein
VIADLCLHELGYLELDRRGSEPLSEITTERDERSAIATASSEPFSKAHMFAATCARQQLKMHGFACRATVSAPAASEITCLILPSGPPAAGRCCQAHPKAG